MTPLSRDLHPSNGRRAPKDEVVVSITSAPHHRGRKQEEQLPADHDELDETFPTPQQQELLHLLAEGAAAASLAGLRARQERDGEAQGGSVAVVVTGGNVSTDEWKRLASR